jgi:thioredoxin-related protein
MFRLRRSVMVWAMILVPVAVHAQGLPAARDLARDAQEAKSSRTPILVFFTSRHCLYCHEVPDLYLQPMFQRGTYEGQLIMRVVDVGSASTVRNFRGERTDHETFAAREGASFTPIIRLYDPAGHELVPPVIGYTSPDFFAGELEGAIETAIHKLRAESAGSQQVRTAPAGRVARHSGPVNLNQN